MKVLHVNYSDLDGGAARAAYRLHKCLLDEGVESIFIAQNKQSTDQFVYGPNSNFEKLISKIRPVLDGLILRNTKKESALFSVNWLPGSSIVNKINLINPDVVHLHWIAGAMIKIENISKIKAPIVWTLHDMWPFTDGYHYDAKFDTENKFLKHEPKNIYQKSIFKRKLKSYKKIKKITIVGVSSWIKSCSNKSVLLGDKEHVVLPNPINAKDFSPIDKKFARDLFKLPRNKKLILFGAIGASSDPRKGFSQLNEALSFLPNEYELVVFGASKADKQYKFKQHVNYIGFLNDDTSLRALYSACDVMVVPSLMEAFGQTATEAMACGTPVVAFKATGLLDIVSHKCNGYLAKPYDPEDLSKGILWVLQSNIYNKLCHNARQTVLEKFESKVVANRYINLYAKISKVSNNII